MYKQINKIVLRKIIYSNFKIKALTNNQARNSQVCNTKMTGFGHEHLLFERQMHWKWERERERDILIMKRKQENYIQENPICWIDIISLQKFPSKDCSQP